MLQISSDKKSDKHVALLTLRKYYTWKNIKKSFKNNNFKISAPTGNEEFSLLDDSYSISNIQDYFEYILKSMKKRLCILQ